jgi:hypothetical protein
MTHIQDARAFSLSLDDVVIMGEGSAWPNPESDGAIFYENILRPHGELTRREIERLAKQYAERTGHRWKYPIRDHLKWLLTSPRADATVRRYQPAVSVAGRPSRLLPASPAAVLIPFSP